MYIAEVESSTQQNIKLFLSNNKKNLKCKKELNKHK
jgi:hypothetical protein